MATIRLVRFITLSPTERFKIQSQGGWASQKDRNRQSHVFVAQLYDTLRVVQTKHVEIFQQIFSKIVLRPIRGARIDSQPASVHSRLNALHCANLQENTMKSLLRMSQGSVDRMSFAIRNAFTFIPIVRMLTIVLVASTISKCCIGQTFQVDGSASVAIGDVWEVSTRHLPCSACSNVGLANFEVLHFENCQWTCRTMDDLLSPTIEGGIAPLTILYVHGNWMERNSARERVRIIDRHLAAQACEPYRLIMFSWPSQRDKRIIRDVRDNAQCADFETYYFAQLLQAVSQTSSRVSIHGFSFGARTVAGGLHLDAGGSIPGIPCLPNAGHTAYRVTLVAPAMDREWLQTNGRLKFAMKNVDQLVNLYNSRDPVLRRFRFIDSIARPIAAGFTGFEAVGNPRITEPLTGSDRIKQFDCGNQIGNTHAELDYYGKSPCFRKVLDNLLWKSP